LNINPNILSKTYRIVDPPNIFYNIQFKLHDTVLAAKVYTL